MGEKNFHVCGFVDFVRLISGFHTCYPSPATGADLVLCEPTSQ